MTTGISTPRSGTVDSVPAGRNFLIRTATLATLFMCANWLLLDAGTPTPRWDEGYHISASRNVAADLSWETLTAYTDSKGPGYHFAYGWWLRMTRSDLVGARVLSVLLSLGACCSLSVGLVRIHLYRTDVFLGLLLAPYFGVVGVMHMSEPLTLLGMFALLLLLGPPLPASARSGSAAARWILCLGCFLVAVTTRMHAVVVGIAGVVEGVRGRRFAAAAAIALTTAGGVALYWALLGGYVRQTDYHTSQFALGLRPDNLLYGVALLGVYTWPLLLDLSRRDLRRGAATATVVLAAWAVFTPEVGSEKFYGLVRSSMAAIPGLSASVRAALLAPAATAGALVLCRAACAIVDRGVDPMWRMAALAGGGGLAVYLVGPDLLYDRYLLMVVPFLQVPLLALSKARTGWILVAYQSVLAVAYIVRH